MNNRLIILIITATVALVSLITFTSSKSYPLDKSASSQSILTNGYALQEVVPEQVYSYVIKKIERYANAKSPGTRYMIEKSLVKLSDTSYDFTLLPVNKNSQAVDVVVAVKNYGDFFSITVYIDNELQDIS